MDETEARHIGRERAGGICEGCKCRTATDWAHRIARSQGGLWTPSNGVMLCRWCHMDDHAHPERAYRRGRMLRRHQDPATTPVYLDVWCGEGWYLLTDWGGYQLTENPYTPTEGTT